MNEYTRQELDYLCSFFPDSEEGVDACGFFGYFSGRRMESNTIKDLLLAQGDGLFSVNEKRDGSLITFEDIVNVMFECPFEDLPLLINEPDVLGVIVRWRLKIGR
jgi:hypothetical protein